MHKIEMHFHTAESSPCGKVSAKESVKLFMENGYEGIVTTDHLSRSVYPDKKLSWIEICERFLKGYRTAKAAADSLKKEYKKNFNVFLGMELRFPQNENDFLVYGFDEKWLLDNPFIIDLELKDFYKIAQKSSLLVIQAHPYRQKCFPSDPEYLDGAEVFNSNPRHDSSDDKAKMFAETYDLICTAGSDFHRPEDFTGTGVDFNYVPASINDICSFLRYKEFKLITNKN